MRYRICWSEVYKEIEKGAMQNESEVIDIDKGYVVDFIRECAWLTY